MFWKRAGRTTLARGIVGSVLVAAFMTASPRAFGPGDGPIRFDRETAIWLATRLRWHKSASKQCTTPATKAHTGSRPTSSTT